MNDGTRYGDYVVIPETCPQELVEKMKPYLEEGLRMKMLEQAKENKHIPIVSSEEFIFHGPDDEMGPLGEKPVRWGKYTIGLKFVCATVSERKEG